MVVTPAGETAKQNIFFPVVTTQERKLLATEEHFATIPCEAECVNWPVSEAGWSLQGVQLSTQTVEHCVVLQMKIAAVDEERSPIGTHY